MDKRCSRARTFAGSTFIRSYWIVSIDGTLSFFVQSTHNTPAVEGEEPLLVQHDRKHLCHRSRRHCLSMSMMVPLTEIEEAQLRSQHCCFRPTAFISARHPHPAINNYLHALLDPLGEGEAIGVTSSHGDDSLVRPIGQCRNLLLKRVPSRRPNICKMNSGVNPYSLTDLGT